MPGCGTRAAVPLIALLSACPKNTTSPPAAAETEATVPAVTTDSSDCSAVYAAPTDTPRPEAPYPSGGAVADMNGDGTLDIVVASGGDSAPATVSITYSPLGDSPTFWQSTVQQYNTRVAVGDVNGDGILDLAVGACDPSGPKTGTDPVNASVYISAEGALPTEPTIELTGVCSPDIALGDIDGDGDLDLAVMQVLYAGATPSEQYVYINDGGAFDPENRWVSTTQVQANAVRFADVNLDGLLDLMIASTRDEGAWGWPFFGQLDGEEISLSPTAEPWGGGLMEGFMFTPEMQVLPPMDGQTGSTVAIGYSDHLCQTPSCPAPVCTWSVDGGDYGWCSKESGMTGGIAVQDIDGDGHLDFLVNRWNPPKTRPVAGPLGVYCGTDSGFDQDEQPLGQGTDFFAQGLRLADLDGGSLQSQDLSLTTESLTAVVTLPVPFVQAIESVQVNGESLEPGSGYLHTPSSNWITLSTPAAEGSEIAVTYQVTDQPDLVVVDSSTTTTTPVLLFQSSPGGSDE